MEGIVSQQVGPWMVRVETPRYFFVMLSADIVGPGRAPSSSLVTDESAKPKSLQGILFAQGVGDRLLQNHRLAFGPGGFKGGFIQLSAHIGNVFFHLRLIAWLVIDAHLA